MAFVVPSGLLAVFKPKGITSNDAVQRVKEILNQKVAVRTKAAKIKVGHGGTLDPLAEGVLVMGIGHGTKNLSTYLTGSKAYIATGLFGSQTDTLDCTGKVTNSGAYDHVTFDMIRGLLEKKYVGTFPQLPPMYSALKRGGVALYESARMGIEVARDTRPVTVYRSQLFPSSGNTVTSICGIGRHASGSDLMTSVTLPYFKMEVECGGGFYIRSLIDDLGKDCGSYAHMTALTRIKQGCFTLEDTIQEADWHLDKLIDCIHRCNRKAGYKLS